MRRCVACLCLCLCVSVRVCAPPCVSARVCACACGVRWRARLFLFTAVSDGTEASSSASQAPDAGWITSTRPSCSMSSNRGKRGVRSEHGRGMHDRAEWGHLGQRGSGCTTATVRLHPCADVTRPVPGSLWSARRWRGRSLCTPHHSAAHPSKRSVAAGAERCAHARIKRMPRISQALAVSLMVRHLCTGAPRAAPAAPCPALVSSSHRGQGRRSQTRCHGGKSMAGIAASL